MYGTLRVPPNRPPPGAGRSPPAKGERTLRKGGERLKHTKKRLRSVLLTLALLLGLLPGLTPDARAAMPDSFTLTVGGTALTTANPGTTDGKASIEVDETNEVVTLTLEGYNYDGAAAAISFASDNGTYYGNYSLTIVLAGDSTITTTADNGIDFAAPNGYLHFSGTGSLTITATSQSVNYWFSMGDNMLADAGNSAESAVTHDAEYVGSEGCFTPYARIYTPSATPTPADPGDDDLGGITGDDFSNLSFTVSMSNKSSYTGARDPSSYTYRVAYQTPEGSVHPDVKFAANNDYSLPLGFAKNDGGTAEIAAVLLSITKPDGVADGTYTYTLSQTHGADQHNAGFSAKDSELISGNYVTAYTLKLRVSEGKITQAILTDGENKHTGFEIEYGRATGTYTVTLAKRSVTGVTGTFTFDVQFELPESVNSADITIEGWDSTLSFSDGKATAQGVSIAVGGQADISGIPAGTVLRVKETGGLDVYKVTSVVEHLSNATNLASGREADGYTTCGTVTGNGGIITYYNEFGEISLTGVSLRYAPYLAMMGAGLAVSGLSVMRRREEEL